MARAKPSRTAASKPRQQTPEPSWLVRAATEADMEYIAPRLTKGALSEMSALSDQNPLTLLLAHLPLKGVFARKGRESEPVAVFDILPDQNSKNAVMWSAVTEDLTQDEWMWTFNLHASSILDYFNSIHPVILTYAAATNVRHVIWLEHIGFQAIQDFENFAGSGKTFRLFKREAKANV